MSTTDEELEETLHRHHDAFMASLDLSLEELEGTFLTSFGEDDDDDDDIETESDDNASYPRGDTSRPLYPDSDPAICIPI